MQARAPRASDPRRRRGPGPRRRPRARPRGRAQVIDTSGSAAIRFLFRSAVLRPQAGSGAVAVLGRVVRLSLRVPSAALIATAALTPVSRPRAVVPRHASALTHAPQLAPIRWRAVGLRGHQTAAPGARNVSTTRHGSLLSARFLLGKPGGGANAMGALRDGGGGHPPWVLAGSCAAGCVAAVLWSCRWRSRWRWAGCRAWSRPGPRRWRWAACGAVAGLGFGVRSKLRSTPRELVEPRELKCDPATAQDPHANVGSLVAGQFVGGRHAFNITNRFFVPAMCLERDPRLFTHRFDARSTW